MYDELIKALREADEKSMCGECGLNLHSGSTKKGVLFAEAANAIEELSKMETTTPRWISVKERLPEIPDGELFSRPVYVTDGEYIKRACRTVGYDGEEGWEYCGLGIITHWCEQIPLPEPPEEEDNG